MRLPNTLYAPAPRSETPSHLFTIGQAVRRKGGWGRQVSRLDLFRITATLPETGGSPQYRLRNEDERHERVMAEDDLEAVDGAGSGPGTIVWSAAHDQLFRNATADTQEGQPDTNRQPRKTGHARHD